MEKQAENIRSEGPERWGGLGGGCKLAVCMCGLQAEFRAYVQQLQLKSEFISKVKCAALSCQHQLALTCSI